MFLTSFEFQKHMDKQDELIDSISVSGKKYVSQKKIKLFFYKLIFIVFILAPQLYC